MRLNKILVVLPLALAFVLASTPASAQRVGLGLSKVGHNSSIRIGIGFGGYSSFYRPSIYRTEYCAPVVYETCCRTWIPECYETQCYQVWVPECCERQVWIEPVYQTVCDPCCGPRQVLVSAGYYKTVIVRSGHYETRQRQVLIAGHYA
jgi:hypothetical protein